MGLAISAKLVEAINGKTSVKSTPGVGTTFSFTFEAQLKHNKININSKEDSSSSNISSVDDIHLRFDLPRTCVLEKESPILIFSNNKYYDEFFDMCFRHWKINFILFDNYENFKNHIQNTTNKINNALIILGSSEYIEEISEYIHSNTNTNIDTMKIVILTPINKQNIDVDKYATNDNNDKIQLFRLSTPLKITSLLTIVKQHFKINTEDILNYKNNTKANFYIPPLSGSNSMRSSSDVTTSIPLSLNTKNTIKSLLPLSSLSPSSLSSLAARSTSASPSPSPSNSSPSSSSNNRSSRSRSSSISSASFPLLSSSPLNILIVEDNLINQRIAVGMINILQHVADVASDGLKAIQFIENKKYDVVFMDIQYETTIRT